VTQPIADIVARLNELQPPAVFGYPTMLVRLAAEQHAGRLHIAPLAINSTSETLTVEMRGRIEAAFGVPVGNTFGSTEGLVGLSAPGDDVLVFNSDMCIVELVDEHDRPVRRGARSAKVLVTNLTNLVQPLVRYELGDCFVECDGGAPDGHLHATVVGRNDGILHYDDVDVHPFVVRGALAKSPEVADYQVRQTARGVAVDVLPVGPVDTDALTRRLAGALDDAGLARPEVSVRVVDVLAPHPETGKLRRFIPLA
jgi:phenylacetate-coenzyme A ligase PaaK-like adenylate-forming protein